MNGCYLNILPVLEKKGCVTKQLLTGILVTLSLGPTNRNVAFFLGQNCYLLKIVQQHIQKWSRPNNSSIKLQCTCSLYGKDQPFYGVLLEVYVLREFGL